LELEPEEEMLDEKEKYYLLDYLFDYISTKEGPLNPVLSGYFQNLVNTLINRKQKLIIPYIFSDDSKVIDNLLFHID